MTWGKRFFFLLLNVKWNTLSLTGKELTAFFHFLRFFFFLKPCTHLTVTTRTCRREGVQTFQARVCVVFFFLRWAGRRGRAVAGDQKNNNQNEQRRMAGLALIPSRLGDGTSQVKKLSRLNWRSAAFFRVLHTKLDPEVRTQWYICKWGVWPFSVTKPLRVSSYSSFGLQINLFFNSQ